MDRGCAGTIQTVGYQDRDAAGADAAVARARKERQRRGRLGCPGEKKEEITRSPGLFAEYTLTSRMNSQKTPLTAAPSEGPRPRSWLHRGATRYRFGAFLPYVSA
jgi:hypothetical protein